MKPYLWIFLVLLFSNVSYAQVPGVWPNYVVPGPVVQEVVWVPVVRHNVEFRPLVWVYYPSYYSVYYYNYGYSPYYRWNCRYNY